MLYFIWKTIKKYLSKDIFLKILKESYKWWKYRYIYSFENY